MRFQLILLLSVVSTFAWAADRTADIAFRRICRIINQHLSETQAHLDQMAKRVFHSAETPLERGLRLRRELSTLASAVAETRPVAWEPYHTVHFNENNYQDLVATNDHLLDSVRFQSKHGLIPPESRAIVPWGHGWTGLRSHSGSVIQQVNFMNSRNRSGSYKQIHDLGNWVPTASIAVDGPHHGAGPRDGDLKFPRHFLNWRHKYYSQLAEEGRGLPLVPATRSAENVPVAELNLMYPELFKGMIWMSPVLVHDGTVEGLQGFHEFNVSTNNQTYHSAFEMFTNLIEYMRTRKDSWANVEHPFGNPPKPTLIFTGSEDKETWGPTREKLRDYARRYPDKVFLVEIPGAGHNVFEVKSEADKVRNVQAWSYVYWFLRKHILEEPATLPPFQLMYGRTRAN